MLLFNMVGYKFVANYFELKATRDLQVSLDQKNYNESDLISFKLPLTLPYISNSNKFVSFEGNIDINGINYQYVKKRIYNDTLELLCIPNFTKSIIKNTQNNLANVLYDIASSTSSKKMPSNQLVKVSISDFTEDHHFDIYHQIFTTKLSHDALHIIESSFDFLQRLEQPPEA